MLAYKSKLGEKEKEEEGNAQLDALLSAQTKS